MISTLRKLGLSSIALLSVLLSSAPVTLAYKGPDGPTVTVVRPLLRLEDPDPTTGLSAPLSTRVDLNFPTGAMEVAAGENPGDYPYTITWNILAQRGAQNGTRTTVTCEPGMIIAAASTEAGLSGCAPSPVIPSVSTSDVTPPSIFIAANAPMIIEVTPSVKLRGGKEFLIETSYLVISDKKGPTLPSIAGMKPDPLVTTIGHVTIRTRDLLGYALRMHQDLTKNDATNPIYQMYSKSRSVANVLFIIALVIIAFLYNFAVLISRDRLRRLLILFTVAIIGVNFSYTITTIAVQGSEKLFSILLVRDDQGTQIEGGDLSSSGKVGISGQEITEEDLLTAKNFTYSGFVGASQTDPVDATRAAPDAKTSIENNRYRENIYFNLALMVVGALAQFAIVIVLLARIVILWAFIIVAPFFFILAIFKFSQEIFKYWGWFFTRWIVIGPLLALFLSVCVRIWTSQGGIPVSSSYERADLNTFIPNIINIWVGAPGVRDMQGINLETPDQVMKYMMGLMMLWLSVLLPFWLTRRISIFSPQGEPTLLSRLMGSGNKAKIKVDAKQPVTPEGPKPPKPLKSGFTFNDASKAAAVASVMSKTTIPASVGARTSVSASAIEGARTSATNSATQAERDLERERAVASAISRSSLGSSRVAGMQAAVSSTLSTEAESVLRGAARRMEGVNINATELATQAKPKAVPRSMDAQVQSIARIATKSEVPAAQLRSLTQAELSDLRTNLSSLASSSVLGQSSVITKNLRAIDGEVRSRSSSMAGQHEIRVKVQVLADRAQTAMLQASDLATMKTAELQSLRGEIERRVHENPALKVNQDLRANYQLLSTQISSQSIGSIASINTAITAQTSALIQSITNASIVQRASLQRLSVPELKEASLSLHRMERALHSTAGYQVMRDNLSALREARGIAGAGTLDPTKVAAAVSKATTSKLSAADLASLSGSELDAVSQRLVASASSADSQVLRDNLALLQQARQHAGEGTFDESKVTAALGMAATSRLGSKELSNLSGRELDAVANRLQSMSASSSIQVVHDNIAAVRESRAERADGELHSALVDAVLAKATSQRLTADDIRELSGRDIDAISAELTAIEALGSKMQTSVTVNASSPEYKESVVTVRSEVKMREDASGGSRADGGASHPSLVQHLMEKMIQGQVLTAPELQSLSLADLRSLNRQASAVGVEGGDDKPLGPDGDALQATLAIIIHETEQRKLRGVSVPDTSPAPLATALGKVRSNIVLKATDLAVLGDSDLGWLRAKVTDMLAAFQGEKVLMDAVDGVQQELRSRRIEELRQRAATQSPKVAELFNAVIGGARLKMGVVATLQLEDLRLLTELTEKASSLLDPKITTTPEFAGSLRDVERAFQKASLTTLVQSVLEASPAAQAVLMKIRAAEAVTAGELESLSLPEMEAVQAESYRLNLIAPPQVKEQTTYRDNLGVVTQVYEARVIEGKDKADSGDTPFRFIAELQAQVGSTLEQKISELKAASKDDLAAELSSQQDDLGQLLDQAAELSSQRAQWIEYFRVTPVPKVQGIKTRREWIEAERKLTRAISQEIASSDWILQAKGIADAASNLLMDDTTGMSPVQVLTALALKEAASNETLKLLPSEEDELVFVPAAQPTVAQAQKLRTFDEDDREASRSSDGSATPLRSSTG